MIVYIVGPRLRSYPEIQGRKVHPRAQLAHRRTMIEDRHPLSLGPTGISGNDNHSVCTLQILNQPRITLNTKSSRESKSPHRIPKTHHTIAIPLEGNDFSLGIPAIAKHSDLDSQPSAFDPQPQPSVTSFWPSSLHNEAAFLVTDLNL